MDEPTAHIGVLFIDEIQQGIQQIVAHIGARRVGDRGRYPGIPHPLHHGFYGQGGEVSGLTVLPDGHIHRLIPGIVRDAAVHKVDGHFLRSDSRAAARLSHADDRIGFMPLHSVLQNRTGAVEPGWDFQLDDLGPGNSVRQQFDCLISRVDGLAAEGIEAGN